MRCCHDPANLDVGDPLNTGMSAGPHLCLIVVNLFHPESELCTPFSSFVFYWEEKVMRNSLTCLKQKIFVMSVKCSSLWRSPIAHNICITECVFKDSAPCPLAPSTVCECRQGTAWVKWSDGRRERLKKKEKRGKRRKRKKKDEMWRG